MSRFVHPDAERALAAYLDSTQLDRELGWGVDGVVYRTARPSAVKVFKRGETFERELAAYQRLSEHGVSSVRGFVVPELIGFNRKLRVIEMSIVRAPCVLDFANSTLDYRHDFTADALEHWRNTIEEVFEDRASVVMAIFNELWDRYGICHEDLSAKNVQFE